MIVWQRQSVQQTTSTDGWCRTLEDRWSVSCSRHGKWDENRPRRQRQPLSRKAPSNGRSSAGERRLATSLRIAVHHVAAASLGLYVAGCCCCWHGDKQCSLRRCTLHGSRRQLMLAPHSGISAHLFLMRCRWHSVTSFTHSLHAYVSVF